MPEPEYIYRIPRFTRHLYAALFSLPILIFGVAASVLMRSWLIGVGAVALTVLNATWDLWLWSKAIIVIDAERIRWPLKRRELRWNEVDTSKIVRVFGMEYARVETKNGKVRWIALERVGGREYRARLLARLGLG